jgi:hypothetical protein
MRALACWFWRCCFRGLAVEATALPISLRLIVTASAVQLDPAHEADARFFKGDRGCWKAWLRSARLTNACGRRPSAPLRKVIESPVQHRGQPGRRVFLRHILIMRLLATASVSDHLGGPPRQSDGRQAAILALRQWPLRSPTDQCIGHVAGTAF